jgi:hypothetical protein
MFVAPMEDILDLYAEPYDPARPRVCVDETPYHLIGEHVAPCPGAPGRPAREDYTYTREGTCNLFGLFQPEVGWRHIKVTAQHTNQDFAYVLKDLVDVHFPTAMVIRLVTDNLNTHGLHALYATFPPAEARRIARKLEWHYTPKHGSWLNMVEIELGILVSKCLNRRLPTPEAVAREVSVWEAKRNADHVTVCWQFTTAAARQKLLRLYPIPPDA